MTDPIHTFDSLKSAYLRYFDSPFDLRSSTWSRLAAGSSIGTAFYIANRLLSLSPATC
jgi:hypothetical protein